MADTVNATTSIGSGASLNVRPSSDEEWIIHNIYTSLGNAIAVYRWNNTGTTPEILVTKTSVSLSSIYYHCTLSDYLVIKNLSGSTIYVSYDGVIL
jgi:hypothetical protein